jgi:carbon starvation protein
VHRGAVPHEARTVCLDTILPATWILICTLTAGWQKVFHENPAIGFLSHARTFGDALAAGQILAPAKSLDDMHRIVFNDYLNATMAGIFVALVLSMLAFGIRAAWNALGNARVTASEVEFAQAAE